MQLSFVGRALVLGACIPLGTAGAQRRSTAGGPDKPDTVPSTRVIVLPAVDRYNVSRLESLIKDLRVVALFTTDGPVARALAEKLQAVVGASVIPLVRTETSVDEAARAMIDTVVDKTARRNMNRAIIVVAEPDLLRPFLRGAVGEQGATAFDEVRGMATFIVFVRADNRRLMSMRPL